MSSRWCCRPPTSIARSWPRARCCTISQHPFVADARPLIVSASIGIAGVPWHAATRDEVLQKADSAMYLAKNDKTGYVVYNASRDQRANNRVSLASSMRQAIDDRQFVLDYQPIIQIHTGSVLAIESLVRWNHPELGRLLPDEFIRVAEHTGLVNPLTSFIIDRALTEWPQAARPDDCALAINISPRSLHHGAFPGQHPRHARGARARRRRR